MSWQANNAGLLEIHKQYLKKLADLVPGAVLRKGQADNAWGVAHNGRSLVLTLCWRMTLVKMDGFVPSPSSSQR